MLWREKFLANGQCITIHQRGFVQAALLMKDPAIIPKCGGHRRVFVSQVMPPRRQIVARRRLNRDTQ